MSGIEQPADLIVRPLPFEQAQQPRHVLPLQQRLDRADKALGIDWSRWLHGLTVGAAGGADKDGKARMKDEGGRMKEFSSSFRLHPFPSVPRFRSADVAVFLLV